MVKKSGMSEELINIIRSFKTNGEIFADGNRNMIKVFPYQGTSINIKSFKIPIFFNGIVYKYFRKSKARRSFENANILIGKDIGTPKPIGYYENYKGFLLRDSYYVCEHVEPDFVFKAVFENVPNLDSNKILRGIAKFTYALHEKGIEFLDHSPGNTLIKIDSNGDYEYSLVDLNRMKFHRSMSFKTRMNNMKKLTPSIEMIKVISNEYAKLYDQSEEEIFNLLWKNTQDFQSKFARKKALKRKFFFWKKKQH
jgi:hypothetical protein